MEDDDDSEPLKWPDVPRVCFAPGHGFTDASVKWVQSRENNMFGYVEGYRKAACALFDKAVETNMNPDFLFFPLAFLWRHHLELAMKDVIAAGRMIEGEDWGFPPGHVLPGLWKDARPHVVACGSEDSPELPHVEANISEFHKVDPAADGFRYPLNRKGTDRSMPGAPEQVDVHAFHDAMLALANFFSAVRAEQDRRWDYMCEQLADER